jgi:O-antigen/teichoic acid export membrane protein
VNAESQGDDGLRGKVSRSIGWVVLERWGSRVLQLVVFAVLTRFVAPELFGIIALATSVVAVLQVIVDSGFSKALIQLKELEARDASSAFWTSAAAAVLLYAALYLSAPFLAAWMGEAALTDVLRVMGLVLPISALSQTPAALLERAMDFRVLSLRQLLAATVGAAVAIPLALAGAGVWALVAQTLVTSATACAVLWASTSWRPQFTYSLRSLRRLWPVGVGIMGTELLDALQNNIDKLVIGFFFSAETLGYYYLAQRLGTILLELVTSVISRVSFTTFSRLQDDLPRLNRILRQMTFVASLVAVPVFGIVALFAEQLIPAFSGPGWQPAIPILWGLAGGWALSSVMYFDRTVLLATSRAGSAFWLALLQNGVGLVLVFALLPLGIAGVVISRWARVFTWPVRLWVMHRAINLRVARYVLQLVRVIVAFVPSAALIVVLQQTAWADLEWPILSFVAPVGVVATALYAGLAWWLAGSENRAALRPFIESVTRRVLRRRPPGHGA